MKHIKKIVNFFICTAFLFAISFSFVGCSEKIYEEGLENFSTAQSSNSYCKYVLPTETFLEDYAYIDGDWYYYWSDDFLFINERDCGLMWLQYDEVIYESVKEVAFSAFSLSDEKIISINGYDFYQNLSYNQKKGYGNRFPEDCFVAFNEWKKIFVSFFLYVQDDEEELLNSIITTDIDNLTEEEWSAYLTEFFPFYDFSA